MAEAIPAVIGAGTSLIGSSKASSSAKSAAKTAAGYQPKYSSEADRILMDLMKQQSAYRPDFSQYQPVADTLFKQYQDVATPYTNMLNTYMQGAFNDSQSEIYQELLRNTQQGARSGLSARGLNVSPYGGALEDEAVRRMNLQWATDRQARQESALQNYMAGQTGLQGLGTSALNTALALEQLKKGWSQSDINNLLSYLGRSAGNPAAAAQIMAQQGQREADLWGNIGKTAGNINWGALLNRGSGDWLSNAPNVSFL